MKKPVNRILVTALILSAVACAVPEQRTGEQVKTSPPEMSLPEKPIEANVPDKEETIKQRARRLLKVILGGVNR